MKTKNKKTREESGDGVWWIPKPSSSTSKGQEKANDASSSKEKAVSTSLPPSLAITVWHSATEKEDFQNCSKKGPSGGSVAMRAWDTPYSLKIKRPTGERVTLTSLPQEILTQIAVLLDLPTAISFSRVSRLTFTPADHRIWRDLGISLNPHYGEYPLVQPHQASSADLHQQWALARAKEAEERHRAGLREKVRTIIMRSNERRCKLVESVTLIPRPVAISAQIMLLELLSPTLKRLEIRPPVEHPLQHTWPPADEETLDIKFLDCGMGFAALSQITLTKGSIRWLWTISLLCDSAPALETLDIDVSDQPLSTVHGDRRSLRPTKTTLPLRRFRAVFDGRVQYRQGPVIMLINVLLRRCLGMEELVLVDISLTNNGHAVDLGPVAYHPRLVKLCWNISIGVFSNLMKPYGAGVALVFQNLEILILEACTSSGEPDSSRVDVPPLHSLKHLFLQQRDILPHAAETTQPRVARPMLPDHPARYHGHGPTVVQHVPRSTGYGTLECFKLLAPLSNHSFDQYDRCIIHSWRRVSEEVLHVRVLSAWTEIMDVPETDSTPPITHALQTSGLVSTPYTAKDGLRRVKLTIKTNLRLWQDYTDFRGLCVPLGVLERMRIAEGVSVEKWEGRRVGVGREAWRVLTDWSRITQGKEANDGLEHEEEPV